MRVSSKKLRNSARGQDCTVRMPGTCNHNLETTVLAHLPCGQKGMRMKGFDTVAVYACSACHDVIDGRAAGEVDWSDMPRAIAETHEALIRAGILTVKGAA
ncbi:nuclease domain-containing protein [Pseudomonas sp. DR 5-09]|uniref:nuclease domain-containing protein n=1 Tax=Pseudomonas sp. DR 5-09 TaxID=1534110 RepID=UPI0007E45366|nr:nuclease domain-containing protein [Pseudomonas sp. DR 5-09]